MIIEPETRAVVNENQRQGGSSIARPPLDLVEGSCGHGLLRPKNTNSATREQLILCPRPLFIYLFFIFILFYFYFFVEKSYRSNQMTAVLQVKDMCVLRISQL
jgi:hypothetical protein